MDDRDGLIEAQGQVIGMLFEVVKRLQANIDLDHEYYGLATGAGGGERMAQIAAEREENARVAARLLEQLDS